MDTQRIKTGRRDTGRTDTSPRPAAGADRRHPTRPAHQTSRRGGPCPSHPARHA
ncbi:MAG: hypothetical protein ABR926_10235 [Streptosporangiaceae bacterium]